MIYSTEQKAFLIQSYFRNSSYKLPLIIFINNSEVFKLYCEIVLAAESITRKKNCGRPTKQEKKVAEDQQNVLQKLLMQLRKL
jgi:hypothetical protein